MSILQQQIINALKSLKKINFLANNSNYKNGIIKILKILNNSNIKNQISKN